MFGKNLAESFDEHGWDEISWNIKRFNGKIKFLVSSGDFFVLFQF